MPFGDLLEDDKFLAAVVGRDVRPPVSLDPPEGDKVWDLAEDCWSGSATKRPTAGVICERLENAMADTNISRSEVGSPVSCIVFVDLIRSTLACFLDILCIQFPRQCLTSLNGIISAVNGPGHYTTDIFTGQNGGIDAGAATNGAGANYSLTGANSGVDSVGVGLTAFGANSGLNGTA